MSLETFTIPGYKDIFIGSHESYEELVKDLNSETIITLCAILNGELTCPEPLAQIQKRLIFLISKNFTFDQKQQLKDSFRYFHKTASGIFEGGIIFRRYLLAMILKELNNYRSVQSTKSDQEKEYLFFKAYLKIIDEVNDSDLLKIDFSEIEKSNPLYIFWLCWKPVLGQFELMEKGNMVFEMLKSACLLEYAKNNLLVYLKDYLNQFGFKSPGHLLASFNSIYKATESYRPKEHFRKYTLLNVRKNNSAKHIKSQCINSEIKGTLELRDLKKSPLLFHQKKHSYIILDYYFARKKTFRSIYFELFHQTSLKPEDKILQQKAFNKYSQEIGDLLEAKCLKPIITLLAGNDFDKIHFDDKSEGIPDGYVRKGRKIFLFEYKAYFFPESLVHESDFNKTLKYFNDRFIVKKGIGQIKEQITKIYNLKFDFDKELKNLVETGSVTIYPIITFNEYHFGLTGLSQYLEGEFKKIIPQKYREKFSIMPLALINLETILDMVLTDQDINDLKTHLNSYQTFTSNTQYRFFKNPDNATLNSAFVGFDNYYYSAIAPRPVSMEKTQNILTSLLKLTGISLDELNRKI
ncbi:MULTISPECIES: hypothetical protein [Sphingobacterium]|uniref:hypothetical protein n=1 Tax=Sphingobacterium TaxID=28453 RepID=UPI00257F3350|nr:MULTISPECIES: hypothetical protein [Sphingobacterium]